MRVPTLCLKAYCFLILILSSENGYSYETILNIIEYLIYNNNNINSIKIYPMSYIILLDEMETGNRISVQFFSLLRVLIDT